MPLRPLSPELQKVAIEELNEVPERVAADIEALRTWIAQQPYLKARTDDQFLVTYLRGCKYSLERVKTKIDRYYTLRTKYPELYTGLNVDMELMLKIIRKGGILNLPKPLHNGQRIGIMRMGVYDPNEFRFEDVNRAAQLITQVMLCEDDYANINGVVHIMDLENVGAAHFLQMSPSYAKKMTVYTEEALPIRLKAGHFINMPGGFDKIFNMFKPLMSEKQQKRLYLHGKKWDDLYEQVPQKYLPVEYGGENGSIAEIVNDWEKRVLSYQDYFAEEANYGTDEKLRPGKPIDFESLFGMEGSFRKLDVD